MINLYYFIIFQLIQLSIQQPQYNNNNNNNNNNEQYNNLILKQSQQSQQLQQLQSQQSQQQLYDIRSKSVRIHLPYDIFSPDSIGWKKKKASYNSNIINDEDIKKIDYSILTKAQDFEDIWLYENWFYGMENGIIMESGALDGITYSTTFFFEKYLNWSPIHIEADPRNYMKLIRKRENAVNVNAALCSETKLLHYTLDGGGQVQGFVEFMSPGFLRKWHNKIYRNITQLDTLPTVQCVQLSRLLNELNVNHIDIWILDVEGAELSVLQGTNFNEVQINTIVMECDNTDLKRDQEKVQILEKNQFTCQQVERNCFCKHANFQPKSMPRYDSGKNKIGRYEQLFTTRKESRIKARTKPKPKPMRI